MPFGLTNEIIEKIASIFQGDARIRHIWLYGSRVKGREREGSDIDLCLESPQLNLSDLSNYEVKIDDLSLPWKLDISLMHTLDNPKLTAEIRNSGVDLWQLGETIRKENRQ
jgi:predicted nucleotidyltransferase